VNQVMRILIAYDGSSGADAALNDLQRVGLPNDVEAIVISVADVCLWPASNPQSDASFPRLPGVEKAHRQALQAVEQARMLATQASRELRVVSRVGVFLLNLAGSRQPGPSFRKLMNGDRIWWL